MAWYRIGTIAVTNGSAVVTGTGTAFVANIQIGHAINLPDGRAYEVAAINSDTQITLGSNYLGATASGQTYSIQPNQGFAQQAAAALAAFLTQYSGYLSTALAGRFADGTVGAPGITFASDQDTGLFRTQENAFALVTGGVSRLGVTVTEVAATVGILSVGPSAAASGTGGQVRHRDDTGNARWATGIPNVAAGTRYYVFDIVNNVEALTVLSGGNVGIGTSAPANKLHVVGVDANTAIMRLQNTNGRSYAVGSGIYNSNNVGFSITDLTTGTSPIAIDGNQNLLINTVAATGNYHEVRKAGAEGTAIFNLYGAAAFFNTSAAGQSSSASAFVVQRNSTTNRSINAGGTINASGADYAEYMAKAQGCGAILKGDVCGVDADGKLVTAWSAAKSFVVKSTNPNLVGGDTWAAHLGDRPNEPALTLPLYEGPEEPVQPFAPSEPAPIDAIPTEPLREDGEDDDAFALRKALYLLDSTAWIKSAGDYHVAMAAYADESRAYAVATATYLEGLAAYQEAMAAHAAAVAQAEVDHDAAHARYVADHSAFEEALEAARATVDRIAFCGQVPVNVAGDFTVGDYIVAAQDGDAIKAVAVAADTITFDQYRLRVGKVWAVRDGRAWIDVQHG